VSFLAVTVGARYLFCVALVSPEVGESEVLLLLFGDIAVRASMDDQSVYLGYQFSRCLL
jgi:hypothetical protein